jgi:hypothetical protein
VRTTLRSLHHEAVVYMKHLLFLLVLLSVFCFPCHHAAAMSPAARAEVDYLISYVEKSGLRFVRSGREHTAVEGAAHLRMKLDRSGGRVNSAEDFITRVASKSYLTGSSYLVKTSDGRTYPTGPWLTDALAKYRAAKNAKQEN